TSQIMKEMLTALFRKHRPHWNWKALGLVIDVCFDETLADADHSKTLSMREALVYSASLSLDSLASGIGAGIQKELIPSCLLLTFCAGFLLTLAGIRLGKICHAKYRLSWLGGVMLLMLAFCRLFCST
ncbi:MAG: manganese efflux pump, partial [Oscillospiraceae bacterium]|nr:manganese efflux pump [Oscillospiraceae bacterium]